MKSQILLPMIIKYDLWSALHNMCNVMRILQRDEQLELSRWDKEIAFVHQSHLGIIAANMNTTKSIIISDDFSRFTPELSGLRQIVFTCTIIFVVITALLFQRAIYKSLKRLGSRTINQMIVPTQVNFTWIEMTLKMQTQGKKSPF